MIVNHLNSRDIYHRDLKPENFMIRTEKNGRIYLHLSDFGLAKNLNPDYTPQGMSVINPFLNLAYPRGNGWK
jgi:serine/threonine protein kinase